MQDESGATAVLEISAKNLNCHISAGSLSDAGKESAYF